jgi:membrane dipeptidase
MQGSDDTALDVIISHFQHIIDLVGDEHVSFGTDFDGTDIPAVIRDATGLPLVLREFKRLGYSDDRIERICNANFLRVAAANWLD